jgi:hypothetical protein
MQFIKRLLGVGSECRTVTLCTSFLAVFFPDCQVSSEGLCNISSPIFLFYTLQPGLQNINVLWNWGAQILGPCSFGQLNFVW